MRNGGFVLYEGALAVVVRDGTACSEEAGGDLRDHLGLWFGEVSPSGRPIVRTIPSDLVAMQPPVDPEFEH